MNSHISRQNILCFILVMPIAALILPGLWPAQAATITVNSTDDLIANDGLCTLREAVIAANANTPVNGCAAGSDSSTDKIVLADGATYVLTITSTNENGSLNGDLDVTNNTAVTDLILKVTSNGTAIISQDGTPDDRILHVLNGSGVDVIGVTFQGGNAVSAAGILNEGILTLTNCTVAGNTAGTGGGGGIFNSGGTLTLNASTLYANTSGNNGGSGLYNNGTATVNGSTISGNSTSGDGGGIYSNAGMLTLNGCTIVDNSAQSGGGIFNFAGATMVVNSSSISNNTSSGMGADGGGAIGNSGTLTLNDSVLSGNFAYHGGGIWNLSTLTVNASMLPGNSGYQGGAIYNQGSIGMNGSILSGNSAYEGGGIFHTLGSLTLSGSSLLHNWASLNGDAVYSNEGLALINVTAGCIAGNGDTAVYNTVAVLQKFESNYWGAANGPSGVAPGAGDSVSANVDYNPFNASAPASGCANLVLNGDFETDSDANIAPDWWLANGGVSIPTDGQSCGTGCVLKLTGSGATKKFTQQVPVQGAAGDALTFNASSKAASVPAGGTYAASVTIYYLDGTWQTYKLNFNTGTHGFQTESVIFTAAKSYWGVKVVLQYKNSGGTVQFDNVSLALVP